MIQNQKNEKGSHCIIVYRVNQSETHRQNLSKICKIILSASAVVPIGARRPDPRDKR